MSYLKNTKPTCAILTVIGAAGSAVFSTAHKARGPPAPVRTRYCASDAEPDRERLRPADRGRTGRPTLVPDLQRLQRFQKQSAQERNVEEPASPEMARSRGLGVATRFESRNASESGGPGSSLEGFPNAGSLSLMPDEFAVL